MGFFWTCKIKSESEQEGCWMSRHLKYFVFEYEQKWIQMFKAFIKTHKKSFYIKY